MARKSKDPRKPSQAFLAATNQLPKPSSTTPSASPAVVTTPAKKGKSTKPLTEQDELLRNEIKALGGDEEDWEMLRDLSDDESEIEGETVAVKAKGKGKEVSSDEKSLKNELSAFMKSLDFAAVAPGDATVDDEDDEAEGSSSASSSEEEQEDVESEASEEEQEEESADAFKDQTDYIPMIDEVKAEEKSETVKVEEKTKVEEKPEEIPGFVKKSGLAVTAEAGIQNIPSTPIWTQIPLPSLPQPATPLEPLAQFRLAALTSRANALFSQFREGVFPGQQNGSGKGKPKREMEQKSTSDQAFLKQILADGTHQDKLSALILLVRESPLHRVAELERLRVMAGGSQEGVVKGGGGREERLSVMRALGDWWVSGGGKEGAKLRYFADQPLLPHPALTDRHLLLFAFEDWLKKWFFSILQILEVYMHDTVAFVKMQALGIVFKLLAGNPEQEQNLLRLGVNKLGDTDKSVASKASHLILVLLQAHPAMKAVVIREVAALVLKPPTPPPTAASKHVKFDKKEAGKKSSAEMHKAAAEHARYYGIITLNQMMLSTKERDVAARLVEVYFEVFRELLGINSTLDTETKDEDGQEKITGKVHNWQGRKKGTRNGKKRDEKKKEGEVESGDAKLIAAVLTGVTRALPYARLEDEVFEKHAEMLFKVTHTGTFNISIRALTLIFQISSAKEATSDRFYRTLYESLLDPRLTDSNKQAMYLNLLFKAMRVDKNLGRVMAFVKRLLQVMMGHQPPFICGALYLLGELFNTTSGLSTLVSEAEDSGVEHFEDVPEEGEEKKEKPAAVAVDNKPTNEYDGKKRDPAFANAKSSCLWELIPFTKHFHPSVSLQANQLVELNLPLSGSADIDQNTLVAFLDRFAYRNPKKTVSARGASIMQPAAASRSGGVSVVKGKGSRVAQADNYVNDEKFWNKKVEDVPADQLFFHKFFSIKHDREKQMESARNKRTKKGESEFDGSIKGGDDDEEDSDPEEAEVWKAMQLSMPQTQDDLHLMDPDSDDDDIEFSDDDEEDEDLEGGDASDSAEDDESRAMAAASDEDSSDDELDFPIEEDSDDLLDLDDMPNIPLTSAFPDSDEEAEEEELDAGTKRKRGGKEDKKERKKKRKLPTLASAEDYAALINDGPEDDL